MLGQSTIALAWVHLDLMRWPLTVLYLLLLGLIAAYGLHRYWLVHLYNKHCRQIPRPARRFDELPPVTVQLPVYNEGTVVQRIIDAACRLDYPADRLQIQVLDDSTDGSAEMAQQRVAYWAGRGVNIQYRHRDCRTGYKAGALAEAMPEATGRFIAIFDADFVPPRHFLRRTIHYFTDPSVGMVQARWEHLNRDESLLTRGQAIFLDGHFIIEHTARNRSGAWINFNGTAGVWRREAIESAGGWHYDTLTEDVDLSYRAQLAGWSFVFLPWLACPAELPPEINAFKSQQHRWTKGSIQTALKLLPTLLRAKLPLHIKLEAVAHLTSPMVYLYITLLALLFYPAIFVNLRPVGEDSWLGLILGMSLFGLGSVSAAMFYLISQHAQRRSIWKTLLHTPVLMSIGIGIALNNAVACLEALLGHQSEFVRTPKYNSVCSPGAGVGHKGKTALIPIPSLKWSISLLEIGMGLYMAECIRLSLAIGSTVVSLPFLVLFAAGYFYVGLTSLWTHLRAWYDSRQSMRPQAA